MEYFKHVYTLKEAALLWNLTTSTLRMAITRNKFAANQVRKSGGTWLILKEAMEKIYGQLKTGKELLTIGYEGKTIAEFKYILNENAVDILIDVREIPLSRKKGFSKNSLAGHLKEDNIEYFSFKELGSPKEIRNKLYETNDYDAFFKSYREYIKQPNILDNVLAIIRQNPERNICLMCFEQDVSTCHRQVLSNELLKKIGNLTEIKNI